MPTRILRSNTIANIADFGAIPNDASATAINAAAFRLAFDSGARRISIPEGLWYFEEILYQGNPWLPINVEIFGEGRERTFLRYLPTNRAYPAFQFAPSPAAPAPPVVSRSTLRDLQLIGPVSPSLGVAATAIGVMVSGSFLNAIRDVEIWNFTIGIDLDPGYPNTFTGYTTIERFEINGCTIGIRFADASNSVRIASGRILGALTQYGTSENPTGLPIAYESGVGIDILGYNSKSGPAGGSGVVISQVTVEGSALCLRIRNSHDIVIIGCYFEPGQPDPDNTLVGARQIADIDANSERISILGSVQSFPNVLVVGDPIATQDMTPVNIVRDPEARGQIDIDAFQPTGDGFGNKGVGAGFDGATAAHANHIRNGDFSRGNQFWSETAVGVAVDADAGDFVIGGRSIKLVSTTNSSDCIFQDFTVDHGVRAITAVVRYRVDGSVPTAAFRIQLSAMDATGPLPTPFGFYSDTDNSPTTWRTRALTVRFDDTLTGRQGPRRFHLQLFPYNVDGTGIAGRAIIVDSVWVVDGEYAAPYRPYQEGVEVLRGVNRTILFSGTGVIVDAVSLPFTIPSNAVGMITEMSITSTTNTMTKLIVEDDSGFDEVREVWAQVAGRPTITEYTMQVSSSSAPQWSTFGASAANPITYSVRLKAWIYRL